MYSRLQVVNSNSPMVNYIPIIAMWFKLLASRVLFVIMKAGSVYIIYQITTSAAFHKKWPNHNLGDNQMVYNVPKETSTPHNASLGG